MKLRSDQHGVTLIEMLFTLALMGMLLIGIVNLADDNQREAKALTAGIHLRTITDAATNYIQDNFAAISAVATPVFPAKIDVATLVATNYLPAGFNANNSYGQTVCVLTLEPVANRLETLVVTTGGTALDDGELHAMIDNLGASAGGLFAANPAGPATNVIGSGGSYNFPRGAFHNAARTCGSAGHGGANLVPGHGVIAIWYDQSDYTAGVLYREAIAGRPELNTMNTDLDMGGNNINNANDINAAGNVTIGGNEVITGNSTAADYSVTGIPNKNLSRTLTDLTVVTPGTLIPKPVCPAPLVQQIFIQPVMFSNRDEGGAIQAVQTWATTVGASWQVHMRILVEGTLDTAPGSPGDGWITDTDFTKAGVNYGLLSVETKCD